MLVLRAAVPRPSLTCPSQHLGRVLLGARAHFGCPRIRGVHTRLGPCRQTARVPGGCAGGARGGGQRAAPGGGDGGAPGGRG